MQLTFETQPIEVIKTNMSTQAENPVNGVLSDIKMDRANKENNPTIDDGIPEKSLDSKTEEEIDRLPSVATKETVFKDEIFQDKKVEVIDIIQEGDLVNNSNSTVRENITNGISNSQDENVLNCDSTNVVMSTENVSATKKDRNEESNLGSGNDKSSENDIKANVNSMPINEQLPELELQNSEETSNDLSSQSEMITETSEDNADVKIQETVGVHSFTNLEKLSENVSETTGVPVENLENEEIDIKQPDDSTNIEKVSENVSEKTGLTIENYENEEIDIKEPDDSALDVTEEKEPTTLVNNIFLGDNLTHFDENLIKDIPISEEENSNTTSVKANPSVAVTTESEFIAMADEAKHSAAIDDKQPEEVEMLEVEKSYVSDNEKNNPLLQSTEKYESIAVVEEVKHLAPSGEKELEDVAMLVVEESCITDHEKENLLLASNEKTKSIAIDEDDKSLVSIDKQQLEDAEMFEVEKASTNDDEKENPSFIGTGESNSIAVDDDVKSLVCIDKKQLKDTEMFEVEKYSTNDDKKENLSLIDTEEYNSIAVGEDIKNLVCIDKKQLEDVGMFEVEKFSTNKGDKENPLLIGTEESNSITVDEEKLVPIVEETVKNDKSIEINSSGDKQSLTRTETEINDISMTVSTVNDSISAENKERVDDGILKSNLNIVNNYESVVIATETGDKNGLANSKKEVENVPMEIDDIEIVDLDMEKEIEDVSKSKIMNEETNDDKIILKSISETTENKNGTKSFPTNEDVEVNDLTEAINEIKNTSEVPEIQILTKDIQENVDIDEDDVRVVPNIEIPIKVQEKEKSPERKKTKVLPVVCKLSNTLDILSDDEEELEKVVTPEINNSNAEKQCINIDDDDDDIMLIEEDSNSKESTNEDKTKVLTDKEEPAPKPTDKIDLETGESNTIQKDITELAPKISEKDSTPLNTSVNELDAVPHADNISEVESEKLDQKKPLLPHTFLKTAKKNLAEMTRSELEDFCVLRIVESIVDRSNLSDIKTKVKIMSLNLEDYKKRAMMLTKQNRDLQVVLKSVQEEQKKRTNVIQPLKITRSVGMQVLMHENLENRRKGPIACQPVGIPAGRPARAVQNAKVTKPPGSPAPIPVPRKVPVNNNAAKTIPSSPTNNTGNKIASPNPNGLRNPSPVQKAPEKRTHSRMQASSSVTVDLTDDEPPSKINNKNVPVIPPVRLVPPQNLMAQQRPFVQPLNSPRKVYIPISGPQGQNVRPGQTIMMKSGPIPGPRPRVGPPIPRMQQSPIRITKQIAPARHPAPLPDAMKQYTPPTWKALPPAPDLKLSKVENGIVISWKIDGVESGYETIASYQLYAYQETTAPPCTALWKKIGDVKALPLPMACTLTQFMAGFKYYFAVRAVDVRSRLGPFSLPGSILLLSKV